MASQPPKKALAFDVVVPEGASPEDVVDATSSIVGIEEVYCVQHFGGRNYQVTVNSEAALAQIVDASHLDIRGERVAIVPLGPQVTQVTVLFLPCRVPSEALAQALSPYGKVLHITRGLMGSRPTVTTGTRYVRMEMKSSSPVPNYLRVAGHRVTCDYKGIQRVCRRCGESGHFRMNCTAPFCGRCGTYGHDGKGCSLPCRRCGDPHATVACTIRRSYSEAASKDFPPLQPEAPATDKDEVPPKPVPGPAQDQNPQDATPHPTPAASPVSPDPASASTADDQVCVSRPPVITIERHAGTSLHSVSAGRTDADDSVTSDINHAASSSSANPPTIEESPSTDDSVTSNASHAASSSSANPPTIEESSSTADGNVHIEDSDSSSSETRLQIDEDATPSDVSQESVDVLVPPSVRSSSIKRHRVSSSDSETHSRDRSPLRTPTRPRKPRASGASPGRKK